MKLKFLCIASLFLLNSCSVFDIFHHHIKHKFTKSGLAFKQIELDKKYTLTYWDSENDKPVLLLLHGFGASTEFQWYKQVHDLSADYRLIIPNLLYFGGSTANVPSYSLENQVEALENLLISLKVNSFYLCGVSYGGLVAAELALVVNTHVKKLVIIDSPVKYFTDEDMKAAAETFKVKNLQELLVPPDYKGLKTLLSVAYYKPPAVPKFLLKQMYKRTYNSERVEKKGLLELLDVEKELYQQKLYAFNFPVLLIWGAEDRLIPIHVANQLQKHFGNNSQLIIIPNAAHMPALEQAGVFNKTILEFLKK